MTKFFTSSIAMSLLGLFLVGGTSSLASDQENKGIQGYYFPSETSGSNVKEKALFFLINAIQNLENQIRTTPRSKEEILQTLTEKLANLLKELEDRKTQI
jgi:hypothetical protein